MSMHHKAPCLNPLWQSGRKTVISHPLSEKNLKWYSHIYIRVHFCPALVHWPLLPWKAKDLPGGILYFNNQWDAIGCPIAFDGWGLECKSWKLQQFSLHRATHLMCNVASGDVLSFRYLSLRTKTAFIENLVEKIGAVRTWTCYKSNMLPDPR